MELPERQVAQGWVGLMLVDRDGEEIGSCVSVFADDATELPEWVCVELNGTTVFVPVVGASESDGRVRVAVAKADVAGAPAVGDARSVSQDEEAALYKHYGIEYSRSESETVLPVPDAEIPTEAATDTVAAPVAAEPVTQPVTQTPATEDVTTPPWGGPRPLPDAYPTGGRSRKLLVPVGGAAGGVLGAAVVVRQVRQRRSAASGSLAARSAIAASAALQARRQLAESATPLIQATRQAVRGSARAGTTVAGGTTAATRPALGLLGRTVTSAGRGTTRLVASAGKNIVLGTARAGRTGAVSAGRTGAGTARLTAKLTGMATGGAARLTAGAAKATAGTAAKILSGGAKATKTGGRSGRRLGAVVEAVPGAVSERSDELQKNWRKTMSKIVSAITFGTGYVLGARAGRERFVQIKNAAQKVAARPEVQQATEKVKTAAGDKLQTGKQQATQRATDLTSKIRKGGSNTGTSTVTVEETYVPATSGITDLTGTGPVVPTGTFDTPPMTGGTDIDPLR